MRKIYLSLCFALIVFSVSGQVTLTKAHNAPLVGDVNFKHLYDSVGLVPNGSGPNQLWDFSAFSLKSGSETSNFIKASSAPSGSSYSGTTLVESFGQTYFYMKSSATKYEIVGIQNPSFKLNFSNNNATEFIWPVSFGYSHTDAFSGTANANNLNGNISGNITTNAQGTGTLILPGGIVYTGILQVKMSLVGVASFAFGVVKANIAAIDYTYYDSINKFPVLTVSYMNSSGAYSANSVTIKVNSSLVGFEDYNASSEFKLYPNPFTDKVKLEFKNTSHSKCSVEVLNLLDEVLHGHEIGNASEISETISLIDLPKGIYLVKTYIGNEVSLRKVIKQ